MIRCCVGIFRFHIFFWRSFCTQIWLYPFHDLHQIHLMLLFLLKMELRHSSFGKLDWHYFFHSFQHYIADVWSMRLYTWIDRGRHHRHSLHLCSVSLFDFEILAVCYFWDRSLISWSSDQISKVLISWKNFCMQIDLNDLNPLILLHQVWFFPLDSFVWFIYSRFR